MSTAAQKAFEQYADQYDNFGDEWQDMGVDEHFIAGYYAGFKAAREQSGAGCIGPGNGCCCNRCDDAATNAGGEK